MKLTFLGLPDHPQARVALIPIPFEISTSWKKGTKEAPLEILKVSPNMEFFDEEFFLDPYEKLGVITYPIEELPSDLEKTFERIYERVEEALKSKKFPIMIGGEHTITLAIVKVFKRFYPDLKVVHLDAHLDLRDEYNETKINHATVIRRISELGVPVLSVGIRTICKEEYEFLIKERHQVLWAREVKRDIRKVVEVIKEFTQSGSVYLSLDADVFDPSVAPGVGTPEPGGLFWEEVLEILKIVVKSNLVGMDLVEIRPDFFNPITEYLGAKIIFKILVYLSAKDEGLL